MGSTLCLGEPLRRRMMALRVCLHLQHLGLSLFGVNEEVIAHIILSDDRSNLCKLYYHNLKLSSFEVYLAAFALVIDIYLQNDQRYQQSCRLSVVIRDMKTCVSALAILIPTMGSFAGSPAGIFLSFQSYIFPDPDH